MRQHDTGDAATARKEAMRIIREPEVTDRTGLSRATIWRRVKAGDFPAPFRLGNRSKAVGWRDDEIEAWIAGLQRAG